MPRSRGRDERIRAANTNTASARTPTPAGNGRRHPSEGPLPQGLPGGATTFLGRDDEVSQLSEQLDGARLVTLTGAPGIGKSRLALELARRLDERYADGARLAELAPITDSALVPQTVAAALAIAEVPGQSPTDTLKARLAHRRVLLVLDNCEHLLDACADLVDTLLGGCPGLSVLATSREALHLTRETVWQVPPLPLPEPEEDASSEALARYAAVRLFVERAAAIQPGFALNAYIAPAVAEVCRHLDGIPLAIELAAARVESLTPEEIARRLDDRFGLLTKGGRGVLPRHQTLQAALDWSHDLLSEPERAVLRRLAVFVGGFELEAAETVCAGKEVEPREVCDQLGRLVSKSLVVPDMGSSPDIRYRLLETIRAYAGDRLEQAGEAAQLRDAHADWCLTLAEQAEPELTGPHQQRWLERLEAERANLRSALEWSLSHGQAERALRLAGALVLFWRVRCHFREGRELLDAAVSASDGAAVELRAKALWGAGFMALMAGDPNDAIPVVEESLARFRELGDRQGCARALLILANCAQLRDDPRALSLLEESADLARQAGDSWCLAHALGVAGLDHARRHELPAARSLFEECLTVARRSEDNQGLRLGLLGMGSVSLRAGDYSMAEPLLEEAMAVADELGEDYTRATALHYLGQLTSARGDHGRGRELLDEALALLREVGPATGVLGPLLSLAEVARLEGDPSRARLYFEEALALAPDGSHTIPFLQGLGELAAEESDPGTARRRFAEALDRARAHGDKGGAAKALLGLGDLARVEDSAKRAAVLYREALELALQSGRAKDLSDLLEAVAGLAAVAGRYERAARLLGAGSALRDEHGHAGIRGQAARYEADVALVRKALGDRKFEATFTQGAALSTEEAVALAAKGLGRRGGPASGWTSLTETEQQVAALVVEGLTNAEIAESLFISLGTVKTHLSHIFAKLDVTERRELAREVRRLGLERLGTDR